MASTAVHPTLLETAMPLDRLSAPVRAVLVALLGSLLLTAAAKISVGWPVPMTMQTFALMVIGATFGPRLAVAAVATYLAQGAMGLPVFVLGGGLPYMAGPTGGYLLGYLLAAVAMGALAQRGWDRKVLSALGMFAVAQVLIFVPGVLWMAVMPAGVAAFAGKADVFPVAFGQAVAWGLTPFIVPELLKTALAVATTVAAWRLVGRRA